MANKTEQVGKKIRKTYVGNVEKNIGSAWKKTRE